MPTVDPGQPPAIAPPYDDASFRRLLEVVPAAAYTTDSQGLITDFNRRAEALWGRRPKVNDPLDRY